MIGGLGGSGTLTGGYSGYGSTTIVAGGAGYNTFSGAIKDSIYGALSLTISNTEETLTGSNTYTGGTTIKSGGIMPLGDGTTTTSIIGNVVDVGTLDFDEASGTPLTFGALISDGNQTGRVLQVGGTTVLTNAETYTGGTTVAGGMLEDLDNGSALSSGAVSVGSGAMLNLDNDQSGTRLYLEKPRSVARARSKRQVRARLDLGNNGGTINGTSRLHAYPSGIPISRRNPGASIASECDEFRERHRRGRGQRGDCLHYVRSRRAEPRRALERA